MEKFKAVVEKYNLKYLFAAIMIYALNGAAYFIINALPLKAHFFSMAIDDRIPFCKYFLVFYFTFFFMPELILWSLSFYDREKSRRLIFAAIVTNAMCYICFTVYQVQMVRAPGYPMDISLFDVRSVSDFFDLGVSFIYAADMPGQNCFPSIHAVMGTLEILAGLRLCRSEKRAPALLRLLAVFLGVGTILSTVFMKQHYFIDALVGVLLFPAVYAAVCAFLTVRGKKKNTEKTR